MFSCYISFTFNILTYDRSSLTLRYVSFRFEFVNICGRVHFVIKSKQVCRCCASLSVQLNSEYINCLSRLSFMSFQLSFDWLALTFCHFFCLFITKFVNQLNKRRTHLVFYFFSFGSCQRELKYSYQVHLFGRRTRSWPCLEVLYFDRDSKF